jgi:hypothetical protein
LCHADIEAFDGAEKEARIHAFLDIFPAPFSLHRIRHFFGETPPALPFRAPIFGIGKRWTC